MRLNKALAAAGLCSRRSADDLIFSGAVQVNGQVATTPALRVDPEKDEIRVRGQVVTLPPEKHLYLALHKPVEVMTTAKDPQGRPTVMDILSEDIRNRRPFTVGRLDFYSEGLLLITTDGDLAHRLAHPSWHVAKVYEVLIRGNVEETVLEEMRRGMRLEEGDEVTGVQVERLPSDTVGRTWLRMILQQGVNRQIRRMCRDLDLVILRLRRVQQGPVDLGDLPSGQWRHLDIEEISKLQMAVGLQPLTEIPDPAGENNNANGRPKRRTKIK